MQGVLIILSTCKKKISGTFFAVKFSVLSNVDVVGVQKVRWDKGGTVRAGDYDFFLRERK